MSSACSAHIRWPRLPQAQAGEREGAPGGPSERAHTALVAGRAVGARASTMRARASTIPSPRQRAQGGGRARIIPSPRQRAQRCRHGGVCARPPEPCPERLRTASTWPGRGRHTALQPRPRCEPAARDEHAAVDRVVAAGDQTLSSGGAARLAGHFDARAAGAGLAGAPAWRRAPRGTASRARADSQIPVRLSKGRDRTFANSTFSKHRVAHTEEEHTFSGPAVHAMTCAVRNCLGGTGSPAGRPPP